MLNKPGGTGPANIVKGATEKPVGLWPKTLRFARLVWIATLVIAGGLAALLGSAAALDRDPADSSLLTGIAIGFGAFCLVGLAVELYLVRRPRTGYVFTATMTEQEPKELTPRQQAMLAGFGKVVRGLFFLVSGAAVLSFALNFNSSAFRTPFAQLTIAALGEAIVRIVALIAASALWASWAFADRESRSYDAWGYFGLAAIMLAGVGFLAFGGSR
jgi:hypothetical protein